MIDTKDYTFDCPDGTWPGRLDHKEWGKTKNLRLFFTHLETGERYTFGVFHGDNYTPRGGGPNFKTEAEPGTCYTLTTGHTRTGGPKLVSAKPIHQGWVQKTEQIFLRQGFAEAGAQR